MQTVDCSTPLHVAAAYGNIECIQLLLDHGADPSVLNLEKQSPIDLALIYGEKAAVEILRRRVKATKGGWSNVMSSDHDTDSSDDASVCHSPFALSDDGRKKIVYSSEGEAFIENILPKNQTINIDDTDTETDWKTCASSVTESESEVETVSVPNDIKSLSSSALRLELISFGENPGAIIPQTRLVYERRLAILRTNRTCFPSFNKHALDGFLPLMQKTLRGEFDAKQSILLESEILSGFESFCNNTTALPGRDRSNFHFNYLLLDPRVLANLPARALHLSDDKVFEIFVYSVFYVGKGKNSRTYEHLVEASKVYRLLKNDQNPNSVGASTKIQQILSIWSEGKGVVPVHCFHGTSAQEALSREGCMIEALGLKRLTNIKRGEFYGITRKWSTQQKQMLGILLLKKALQMLLTEGERQFFPYHVERIKS